MSLLAANGLDTSVLYPSAPSTPEEDDHVSLTSLPVELLEQIIKHLDNRTLLSLSKLSRQLNHISTRTLLRINNITGPSPDSIRSYLVSRLAPPELIPVLYSALWLNTPRSITFYFNPDVKRLVFETKGLKDLIKRMEGKMEQLDLHFGSLDRWVVDRLKKKKTSSASQDKDSEEGTESILKEGLRLDKWVWKKAFEELLDCALERGTGKLTITGGDKLREVFVDEGREGREAEEMAADIAAAAKAAEANADLGLLLGFSEWVHRLFETGQLSATSQPPFQPRIKRRTVAVNKWPLKEACLQTFHIQSSMLLQSLFFSTTQCILQTHAATLRDLRFVGAKVSSDVWQDLLSSIQLPSLETFWYMIDTLVVDYPTMTVQTLQDFLTRHPTITSLTLYGVLLPSKFPKIEDEDILPNLTSLEAHPNFIAWILENPRRLPKLTTVAITSEYTASWMDHPSSYGDFDWALSAISAIPREIKLQLKLNKEGNLVAWVRVHVERYAEQGRSEFPKLKNVKELTVSCQCLVKFKDDFFLGLVPQWLGLLPCMEVLNLVETTNSDEILGMEFPVELGKYCKALKKFFLCGEEIAIPCKDE
jgi:hypothetical protein